MFQEVKAFLESKCSNVMYEQTREMAVGFVNHTELVVGMKRYPNGILLRVTVGEDDKIIREEGLLFEEWDTETALIWLGDFFPKSVKIQIKNSQVNKIYKKINSQFDWKKTVAVDITDCSGYLKFLLERTIENDVKPISLMFNYKQKMIEYNKHKLEQQYCFEQGNGDLMAVQSI